VRGFQHTKTLVRNPERKRPPGRSRHRQENVKKNLNKIGWKKTREFGWIRMGSNGGFWEHGIETSGSIKCRALVD
jgi:hypothetical protein